MADIFPHVPASVCAWASGGLYWWIAVLSDSFCARSWMYTKCLRLRELEPFEKFKWHFNYSATTRQNITDYYEDVMWSKAWHTIMPLCREILNPNRVVCHRNTAQRECKYQQLGSALFVHGLATRCERGLHQRRQCVSIPLVCFVRLDLLSHILRSQTYKI